VVSLAALFLGIWGWSRKLFFLLCHLSVVPYFSAVFALFYGSQYLLFCMKTLLCYPDFIHRVQWRILLLLHHLAHPSKRVFLQYIQ
jgi:hypothetical protein